MKGWIGVRSHKGDFFFDQDVTQVYSHKTFKNVDFGYPVEAPNDVIFSGVDYPWDAADYSYYAAYVIKNGDSYIVTNIMDKVNKPKFK